jgi:hypothetical protein
MVIKMLYKASSPFPKSVELVQAKKVVSQPPTKVQEMPSRPNASQQQTMIFKMVFFQPNWDLIQIPSSISPYRITTSIQLLMKIVSLESLRQIAHLTIGPTKTLKCLIYMLKIISLTGRRGYASSGTQALQSTRSR